MTQTRLLTNIHGRGYWPTKLGFHLYEKFAPVPPRQQEAFAEDR